MTCVEGCVSGLKVAFKTSTSTSTFQLSRQVSKRLYHTSKSVNRSERMKFVDPIESESTRERTPSQDAYDSDEEIFEKTTIPAVEVFNMSTADCQASPNSQDDEEAGITQIIDKAYRRPMKFPCPPGPTQAAESNESNKLHNNDNCSFQDGGKITDPRSQLEGTVDEKKPGRSSKDGDQQHTSEASTKQTCV